MTLHLTNKQQRWEAINGVAERITDEIIPCLFHDPDQRAWTRFRRSDHFETLAIDSREMRTFLQHEFWERMKLTYGYGILPDRTLVKARLELLEAKARFDGPEKEVFLRVGENDRIIYVDLCDEKWRAVRIGPDGWGVVDQPPVYFRRDHGMLPLPLPERGGSLDELHEFLNVSKDQFVLVKAWVLAALRPRGPYPLMVAIGSAGSAKSNMCRMLRALTDPNSSPLNAPPREMRDLFTAALSNHVLGYDNLSRLSDQLSDALCRLATGSSNVERRLHTNNEQVRYPQMYRAIVMNGITEFVTAPDLMDRWIILSLRNVTDRRTEESLWRGFNSKKGRIFGGILDLMVEGVRNEPSTTVPDLPRMAEFVKWSVACGIEDFEARYRQNLVDSSLALMEDDPLPMALKAFMADWGAPYEAHAAEFREILQYFGYEAVNARALSADLRKLAPALRTGLGIAVDFPRRTAERWLIRISPIAFKSCLPYSVRRFPPLVACFHSQDTGCRFQGLLSIL